MHPHLLCSPGMAESAELEASFSRFFGLLERRGRLQGQPLLEAQLSIQIRSRNIGFMGMFADMFGKTLLQPPCRFSAGRTSWEAQACRRLEPASCRPRGPPPLALRCMCCAGVPTPAVVSEEDELRIVNMPGEAS